MNKIYKYMSLALLFVAGSALCSAQSYLGYSNGTVARKEGVRFSTGNTHGMAIRIPKEKAALLKGYQITGLKTAFSTATVSNLEIFVTKDLNAEALLREESSGATTSWKDYNFSTPVTIDGDEFYVGYLFTVGEGYAPLLFDKTVDFGEGVGLAYKDGKWEDIAGSGYGAPNIRVNLNSAPSFTDLIVKPVDVSGYYKEGESYVFGGQIFNFGTKTVQSFDISCQVGDGTPVVTKVENANLSVNGLYNFKLPEYKAEDTGRLPVRITVSNINGADDDDTSDNFSQSSTYVYPSWVQKKILIETFTGQTCGNCPTGHKNLERALTGIEDEFIEVAHHAGYYPDAFTMKEDMDLTWFYGGSTYAPAAMFNRAPTTDGATSVVFATTSTKDVSAAVSAFRNTPPCVTLQLLNDFDATTREGDLTVKVRTFEMPSDATHRLHVFLTQDGLVSTQSGAGSNYVHNHVFRGSLTGSWGEDIDLVEGTVVTKTFHYTLPEQIVSSYENLVPWTTVLADMKFVAFVSDISFATSSDDAANLRCGVYNSISLPVTETTTGLSSAVVAQQAHVAVSGRQLNLLGAASASAEVYTPAGQLVARLAVGSGTEMTPGVYLVRIHQADGTVTGSKIIVK